MAFSASKALWFTLCWSICFHLLRHLLLSITISEDFLCFCPLMNLGISLVARLRLIILGSFDLAKMIGSRKGTAWCWIRGSPWLGLCDDRISSLYYSWFWLHFHPLWSQWEELKVTDKTIRKLEISPKQISLCWMSLVIITRLSA